MNESVSKLRNDPSFGPIRAAFRAVVNGYVDGRAVKTRIDNVDEFLQHRLVLDWLRSKNYLVAAAAMEVQLNTAFSSKVDIRQSDKLDEHLAEIVSTSSRTVQKAIIMNDGPIETSIESVDDKLQLLKDKRKELKEMSNQFYKKTIDAETIRKVSESESSTSEESDETSEESTPRENQETVTASHILSGLRTKTVPREENLKVDSLPNIPTRPNKLPTMATSMSVELEKALDEKKDSDGDTVSELGELDTGALFSSDGSDFSF